MPTLFGVNTLYWIDMQDSDNILMTKLKNMHVGAMRFPGGTVSGNYDWRKNRLENPFIFPKEYEERCYADFINKSGFSESIANKAKEQPCFEFKNGISSDSELANINCSIVNPTEQFENYRTCVSKKRPDYKRFLRIANAVGAEPILVINLAGAYLHPKADGSPNLEHYANEAKEWVKDIKTHADAWEANASNRNSRLKNPFKVKYWEIGNENYLDQSLAPLTAEGYGIAFRAFAKAMREADPNIKLGAVGTIGFGNNWWYNLIENLKSDPNWQTTNVKFDFAILHDYDKRRVVNGAINLEGEPLRTAKFLPRLRETLAEALGSKEDPAPVQIAVTEWNITNDITNANPNLQIPIRPIEHCLIVAEKLIGYAKAGVEIATFWPLDLLPGKDNRTTLLGDMDKRAGVKAFVNLAKKAAGGRILAATTDNDDLVDVLVTETENSTEHVVRVFLVNRRNAAVGKTIKGFKGLVNVTNLSVIADSSDEPTLTDGPVVWHKSPKDGDGDKYTITLPAQSFSYVEIILNEKPTLLTSVKKAIAIGREGGIEPNYKVVYKHVNQEELTLSVWDTIPNVENNNRGAVIFFHGGAWKEGDASQFAALSKDLSTKLGLLAVSVQYRLPSATSSSLIIKEQIEDAQSAIQFVRLHATEFGINPNKIAVGGGSAGGYLALSSNIFAYKGTENLSANLNSEGGPVSVRPNALILFNPMMIVPANYSHFNLSQFWSESPPKSPVEPLKSLPPTIIMHGDSDDISIIAKVKAFRDKANSYNSSSPQVDLAEYPMCGHNFFNYDNETKCANEAIVNQAMSSAITESHYNFNQTQNKVIDFFINKLEWVKRP
jgi:acetyl esterase/lipase